MPKKKFLVTSAILLIMAISVFFRFYQLNDIPPGLYPDVAMNGNDALDSLESKDFKLFYPENNGREGLFIWLIALSFKIFGPSIWAMKFVSAVIGTLTVLGTYLLAKALFNLKENSFHPEATSLLAAFLMATSFWHTNFSRIGFRVIMVPFIAVFLSYFLIKGLKEKKLWSLALSGLFFGLGFYTYIGFRTSLAMIPLFFIPWIFIYKKENSLKKLLLSILIFSTVLVATSAPIAWYFVKNSQDFASRASQVSIFSADSPIKEGIISLLAHLGMFGVYGDNNWRHNLPGHTLFPLPLAIFLFLGTILYLVFLVQSIKKKDYLLLFESLFLLGWFFVSLLPGVLTREGIPHALRVLGVVPFAYLITSVGTVRFFGFVYKNGYHRKLITASLVIFLVMVFATQYEEYFISWGKSEITEDAFTKRYVDVASYLNSLGENTKKYLIVNAGGVRVPYPDGLPMPSQTTIFLERARYGKVRSIYLEADKIDMIKPEGKTVIVLLENDLGLMAEIVGSNPGGITKKINNILTYEVNR